MHPSPPASRWGRTLLRAPLFWKLVVSQLIFVGLLFVTATWLARSTLGSQGTLFALLIGGPAVTALLSVWVFRVALRPIRALTETAERLREGDWDVRAEPSSLADHRVERLGLVLNEMLDAMDEARRLQREGSRRVLDAEERDREEIAHELYAGTAQTLAGVLIRLRVLGRAISHGDPAPVLDEVTSEVRTALEEVRTVARRLRPPELDELGILAALEAHARQLMETEDAAPEIVFDGDVPDEDLDPGARLALFRIVQEAVTNAVIHAEASQVRVEFSVRPEAFRAAIVDDGIGFDPRSALPSTDSRLGLVGMRERADYVGGSVTVLSRLGLGTLVRLDVPWGLTEPPGVAWTDTRRGVFGP